ncbi:hypothetical protein BGX26_005054 [Mortierella sp. AD094]|nr:hypothetical protein BGX26_005054 [Mortierella sp. AD094]
MSYSCCNDDYSNNSPRKYFLVPEELLIAQSPNFRIITNFIPRFSGILQCRQLKDLTLHRACPRSLHLVNTNPALKRLNWFGPIPYSGFLSDLESDSMSNLVCLEELSLQQWDVSARKLVPILRRNCKTLKKLSLKLIQGLDAIIDSTSVSDLEVQDISKSEEENSVAFEQSEGVTTFQAPLVLEQLEELTVDCEWPENLGLLDLITKCCPRLKALHLSETLVDDKAIMNRFEDRLKESRPLLRKEERRRSVSGIRYCQDT